jgi:H+-transporting ATPase
MIEAAVILSGVVRHWLDFFIILALLFSNALVAFWEEHQAGNEIAALKAKLANDARVLRDGKWATPKASELVAGDVIRLRSETLFLRTRGCWTAIQSRSINLR